MTLPEPRYINRSIFSAVRELIERDPEIYDEAPVLDVVHDETIKRWE